MRARAYKCVHNHVMMQHSIHYKLPCALPVAHAHTHYREAQHPQPPPYSLYYSPLPPLPTRHTRSPPLPLPPVPTAQHAFTPCVRRTPTHSLTHSLTHSPLPPMPAHAHPRSLRHLCPLLTHVHSVLRPTHAHWVTHFRPTHAHWITHFSLTHAHWVTHFRLTHAHWVTHSLPLLGGLLHPL